MTIGVESHYKCHKNLTIHLTDPRFHLYSYLLSSYRAWIFHKARVPPRFKRDTHNRHRLSIEIGQIATFTYVGLDICNYTSGWLVAKRSRGLIRSRAERQISRLRAAARSNDLTASIWFRSCTSTRASRSVRWRRRCLSTCRARPPQSLSLSLMPFSPGLRVLKSPVELRLCSVRPRRRQCTVRLPPPASSSVVESSQPDDGGRSATLLLVAFPLPARSLLAGPDAAISPRTRTKNRRLVSRRPRSHRKTARRAFSGRIVTVSFARRGASYLPFV